MTLQAPDVDTYCISPHLGFLSDNPPLRSFTKSQYAPWDELIANLPRLISSHSLRRTVDDTLPYIDPSDLSTELENQRAYVVLGFLIHAYVWCETGDDVATGLERQPRGTIPPQLAEPFLHVCDELGLPPVLLYAGLCLWNWKLGAVQDVLPAAANQFYELEQLECVGSFTGDLGETDFNLVPVLVEAEGGPLVRLLLDAVVAGAAGGDEAAKSVQRALEICAETIGRMRKHLAKLYSTLDADFFYHRLRPFLSGGNGMEDRGLPRGFVFQRRDGSEKAVKCIGGSAAQSSLFQFLDLVLGVEHASTGDGDPETLFQTMRAYMPRKHRDFLEAVERLPTIRFFVQQHGEDESLCRAFDDCLEQLRQWRGSHIAVVSKYIVRPARRHAEKTVPGTTGPRDGSEPTGFGTDHVEGEDLTGTGGSALIPFLKKTRDETVGVTGKLGIQ